MFYVTDIETTCTQPTVGALLTVGIVMTDGNEKLDSLYLHLAYDDKTLDESTGKFWQDDASDEARNEAFNWTLNRLHPASAAIMIKDFVEKYTEKDQSFFVANPASFDYPWIEMLFRTNGVIVPFSHRTLCLRSMRFGKYGGAFGEKRGEFHKPEIPHHALHDAHAEAEDLIGMLNDR